MYYYVGTELLGDCEGTHQREPHQDATKYRACVKYLAALVDADEIFRGRGEKSGYVCLRTGIAQEQLRQVWLSYAKKHSDRMHQPAASLALDALAETWPC